MSRPVKLPEPEVVSALSSLSGWSIADGKLHREYKFPDFSTAFAFMTAVALIAEKMDHHPEWRNVFNRVTVDLSTHDAGGITSLDVELAGKMEQLAKRLQ